MNMLLIIIYKLVMGLSKIFDQGLVGSIFCCSGLVSHLWFWVWKISPKIVKFFNFFPLGQKKISSGWVKKCLGQRLVGFLFTSGQKYARVGSGPISTLNVKQTEVSPWLRDHRHQTDNQDWKLWFQSPTKCQKFFTPYLQNAKYWQGTLRKSKSNLHCP